MNFLRRLLRRLFPVREAVPSWASFFNPHQYQHFLQQVQGHLRKQKQKLIQGDGYEQIGLLNLAQLCARNEEKDWPEIIGDHFRTLQKSFSEQKVLVERIQDFKKVEELLAVRLWPENYLQELSGDQFVHRQDLPGTLTALVFDLPSSVRNVTAEEAEVWGKSPDELFEIALANVRENCIPDVSEQDLGEGIKLTLLSDESFFVASHALLLEEHPECVGSFGTLVGIPHRHVLLTYPIEDLRVIVAINMLIPIILGMEKEGPGSISPNLYWYKSGSFTNLPYKLKQKALHFLPPEEFVEILNMLSEPEA